MKTLSGIKCDVLIVGLGPTGLLLCRLLQLFNINFIAVDKRKCISTFTRALNLTPYSLALLQQTLKSDAINKLVVERDNSLVYYGMKKIMDINYDEESFKYKKFYFLPQSFVEKEIYDSINEREKIIFESHEVKKIKKNEDSSYSVEIDHNNKAKAININTNKAININTKFIVGADGGKSFVREFSEIFTSYENYGSYFVLYDIVASHSINEVRYHVYKNGYLILGPYDGNKIRVSYCSHKLKNCSMEHMGNMGNITQLKHILKSKGYGDIVPKEILWFTYGEFKHMLTNTSIKDNIILAGDALHLFSPIGGLNMNMGLQDAASLAWRLAYKILGCNKKDILQDYERERISVIEKIKNNTKYLTDIITNEKKFHNQLKNNFIKLKQKIPNIISGYISIKDKDYGELSCFFKIGYHFSYRLHETKLYEEIYNAINNKKFIYLYSAANVINSAAVPKSLVVLLPSFNLPKDHFSVLIRPDGIVDEITEFDHYFVEKFNQKWQVF